MNDLTPTPIVDKNGKKTTVHKKPTQAPKGSDRAAAVSAPTQAKFIYSNPVVEALADTISERGLKLGVSNWAANFEGRVMSFPKQQRDEARDTLAVLTRFCNENGTYTNWLDNTDNPIISAFNYDTDPDIETAELFDLYINSDYTDWPISLSDADIDSARRVLKDAYRIYSSSTE